LESLPYEAPKEIPPEEIEVIDEEAVSGGIEKDMKKIVKTPKKGKEGQTKLF
jgi:hypothetical protein